MRVSFESQKSPTSASELVAAAATNNVGPSLAADGPAGRRNTHRRRRSAQSPILRPGPHPIHNLPSRRRVGPGGPESPGWRVGEDGEEGRQGRIRVLGAQRRVLRRQPPGDRGGFARRPRAVGPHRNVRGRRRRAQAASFREQAEGGATRREGAPCWSRRSRQVPLAQNQTHPRVLA